jgi:hypothetical protein
VVCGIEFRGDLNADEDWTSMSYLVVIGVLRPAISGFLVVELAWRWVLG